MGGFPTDDRGGLERGRTGRPWVAADIWLSQPRRYLGRDLLAGILFSTKRPAIRLDTLPPANESPPYLPSGVGCRYSPSGGISLAILLPCLLERGQSDIHTSPSAYMDPRSAGSGGGRGDLDVDDLNNRIVSAMDFSDSGLPASTESGTAHRHMPGLSEGGDILSRRRRWRLPEDSQPLCARVQRGGWETESTTSVGAGGGNTKDDAGRGASSARCTVLPSATTRRMRDRKYYSWRS